MKNIRNVCAALESALRAKPNDPEAQINLGRFLHDEADVLGEQVGPRAAPKPYRAQSDLDRKHELERSEKLVDTALREHPNNIKALTLKAQDCCWPRRRYDEAEAIVKQGLAIKGDDPDLLELLASLLQVNASIKVSQAGILKSVKTWEKTNFEESPPKTYIFSAGPYEGGGWRRPRRLEQDAKELLVYAQEPHRTGGEKRRSDRARLLLQGHRAVHPHRSRRRQGIADQGRDHAARF